MFLLLFLVVLMIVTTVATSLYLYFQALCQVLASDCMKFKSCDMLSRNRLCPLGEKISHKSPYHLFNLNYFDSMLNWLSSVCAEFFDLICRSAPKKLFTTCWSVFHTFCHVLRFHHFTNLSLLFLCKNFLEILRNSSSS